MGRHIVPKKPPPMATQSPVKANADDDGAKNDTTQ